MNLAIYGIGFSCGKGQADIFPHACANPPSVVMPQKIHRLTDSVTHQLN
jgi:hypothetical protein